jgi:glycosyltransferase involved in cell wall biosynthesis
VHAFSVVICTHNRADRVGRAIGSVLGQTFKDFELIVVDDGSVDDTAAAVASIHDPRVRYVYRDNGGPCAARNTGVANSSGRYVTFLDDDDEVLPRWLETFGELLAGEDAVATCGAYLLDEQGRFRRTLLPQPLDAAYENYRGLFLSGTFALPRHAYNAVGGFAESLLQGENTELALRLLPYCRMLGWPVRVTEAPLLRYQQPARELSSQNRAVRMLRASEYLLARHRDQLARSPKRLATEHARAGVLAVRLGRYPQARRHFARAVRAQPSGARHWLRLALAFVPPFASAVWRAATESQASHQDVS